jgi:LPS export ABC transporter protein LptC
VVGCFFIAPFLSSCNGKLGKAKVNMLFSDSVMTELTENVEIKYADSGRLKAKLMAPLLERFSTENPYAVMEKGITGYFYNREGKPENSLKANYGIHYEKAKTIEVRNAVKLTNAKNETLTTEKLIWDQRSGKIYTDQFVTINTAENIIYGTGFESNQNFSEYRIFNVQGTINVKDAKTE